MSSQSYRFPSPPDPSTWDRPCIVKEGLDHHLMYAKYSHCGYCHAPNPQQAPRVRHSSMAPPNILERPPSIPLTSRSTPSFQPRDRTSSYRSQHQQPRAQNFGSLPQTAEAQRRQGFRNNLPPPINAGTTALSARRAAASASQAPEKSFPISCKLYISQVLENKGLNAITSTTERFSIKQIKDTWSDQLRQKEFQLRVPFDQSFTDWLLETSGQCTAADVIAIPGYIRHYLCTAVIQGVKLEDQRKKPPTCVIASKAIEDRDSLEEKLAFFKGNKNEKELHIVVDVNADVWEDVNDDRSPVSATPKFSRRQFRPQFTLSRRPTVSRETSVVRQSTEVSPDDDLDLLGRALDLRRD